MTPDEARQLIHAVWVGGIAACGISAFVLVWAITAMGSYWSRREEARGE